MAAFTYSFKVPGLQKNSAQTIGEVLERLENSEQGLTPETLLEASRAEDATLHNEFEWRDTVAAERYRLTQARSIITNLCATMRKEEQEVVQASDLPKKTVLDRAFVSVERGSGAYRSIEKVLTREDWKQSLLKQAKRDADAFIAKYKRLEELGEAVNALSKFVESLKAAS